MSDFVKEYYDNNSEQEWERLNNPYSRVEFLSTMYLIDKYFKGTGEICDIGCGPGRYSIELLKKGYRVTLFELSSSELQLARDKINREGLVAEEYICESAVNLNILESNRYDGILLMGPLYHLNKDIDRQRVLKEAYRILRKGGCCIIAYLNSWGILKAGVTEFYKEFENIDRVYAYLDHQKLSKEQSFTEAYFSTPIRALGEIKAAGFEIISYAGAEGFLAGIETEIIRLYNDNKEVYKNLVKVAAETCEFPQYRDATEHLHVVVRKL